MINLDTITRTEDINLYTDPDGPWIFGALVWDILESEFRVMEPELIKESAKKGAQL